MVFFSKLVKIFFTVFWRKCWIRWNTFKIGWPYLMRSANHSTLPFFAINHPMDVICFDCVNVNGHKIADFVFFLSYFWKVWPIKSNCIYSQVNFYFSLQFFISDYYWQINVLISFILTRVYYNPLNTTNCWPKDAFCVIMYGSGFFFYFWNFGSFSHIGTNCYILLFIIVFDP